MMKQYDNLMEQAHERQNLAMVAQPGKVYGDDLFEKLVETQIITAETKNESKKEVKSR